MATANSGQSIQSQTNRKVWLIIFGSLVFSLFTYGLLCFLITQSRIRNPQSAPHMPDEVRHWVLLSMGIASLMASVIWMYVKTNGKIGDGSTYGVAKAVLMPLDTFQTQSIVALAIAHACAIFGLLFFFMGAAIKDFVPFALGTLIVDLFYILPRGLKYWSSWEQEQKAKGQPTNSPFSQSL